MIVVPMASHESMTLTLWVKAGSRFESGQQSGIAHFLEHMAFKGSAKRPTARAISEVVDSIGGEFNAGTSKESINYYIKGRNNDLETAFDVISDMLINPVLDPLEVEKEKGVIIEEINMYEDTPQIKIGDLFEELVYKGSSLGRDISGTPVSVRKLSRENLVDYITEKFYPENMLLTVSGGVTEKKVTYLTEKYFNNLQSKSKYKSKMEGFGKNQNKPQVKLKTKKNEQAHLIVGFMGYPKGHPKRYAEGILATILGGNMSSRLFQEVRDKRGLAYSIHTSANHYLDTGYLATYAGVDIKKAEEAIKVILDEHNKIKNSTLKINQSELTKAKEYIKGHLALALEDTRDINYFFGEEELMLNKIRTPEEVFKKVDQVKVAEVVEIARELFRPEKLNLAIIGPFNDKEKFAKLLK